MNRVPVLAVLAFLASSAFAADGKPVVAIGTVGISTPAARLHFAEDGVRDALTTALHGRGVFDVGDLNRLQAVVGRADIALSDLAPGRDERSESPDLLLNDYFLDCTVSHYSERIDYRSRGLSRSKTQVADIELQLVLKGARTNEVVASARGTAQKQRSVTQNTVFGGAGAGAVNSLSRDTFNEALQSALDGLVGQMFGPQPESASQSID